MSWFTPQLIDSNTKEDMAFNQATSKVVCVGRNYVAHAKELNNPVPKSPLLFIKPNSTLSSLKNGIKLPKTDSSCHHELEVAILIGKALTNASKDAASESIKGVGLALDLTLRELQSSLKSKGQPWERAKAFDGACPVSKFVDVEEDLKNDAETFLSNISFSLVKNEQLVQVGTTKDMIFPIIDLLVDISNVFTLQPGDIVLTGTPEGVGPLVAGDKLSFVLNNQAWENSEVISE